ncbi:hypothetical protein [Streptomyces atacamensis]|uniref:hypothetical protein n=1 Tax=Streptomyces atacamensis TaxID=531966 RepID=UPI00399D4E7E
MSDRTPSPADQGAAARALAEQARRNIESAKAAAAAAEAARRAAAQQNGGAR